MNYPKRNNWVGTFDSGLQSFRLSCNFQLFKNLSGEFVLKALDYSFLRSFVKMNVKMTLEKKPRFLALELDVYQESITVLQYWLFLSSS